MILSLPEWAPVLLLFVSLLGWLAGSAINRRKLSVLQAQLVQQAQSASDEQHALAMEASAAAVENSALVSNSEVLTARLAKSEQIISQQNQRFMQLNTEYAELKTLYTEREQQHHRQLALFEDQKILLGKEFENLANRIFEEKGKTFTRTSESSLESLLKPFREQISDFRNRVDGIQKDNYESTGSLKKELEQLRLLNQAMSDDAKNLTEALKGDKKKVGGWGEVQLERTLQLSGLVKDEHYQSQAHYKDERGKNNFPDFVVNLPDKKHIVIDSKVSLVDYDQAISATNDAQRSQALDSHVNAVKNHIDGLAGKDYSNLTGMHSPSFVLMFMPIEPAYIEAMRHNKDLYNYGYQKGVILVSHSTLMPILRTVANLWMAERSNAEAGEISERAGEVYNQVCLVAERLQKLGATLITVSKQYNHTVVALSGQQGLHGKVERFRTISNKVTKSMGTLEPIHPDIDLEHLESASSDEQTTK